MTGPPGESCDFVVSQSGPVKIFHPARLTAKPFEDRIRIRLKKFLLFKWLELEGARAIVCAPAEE